MSTCKRCSNGNATFCVTCLTDIMEEADTAIEKLEGLIAKYREALFCPECLGKGVLLNITYPLTPFSPCPTCGPIRESLREGER